MSNEDLARRALACKGWRWLPGMLATDGVSIAYRVYNDGLVLRWATNVPDWPLHSVDGNEDFLPILEDPATLGCLLTLVRESWDDPLILTCTAVDNTGCGWWIEGGTAELRVPWHLHDTEAEALIAALEAAP